jgi:molybdopterin/thiamine biosynthesis adenylyltransferase
MDHTRHTGIYNIPPGFSVTLIGAGGIGATTALALAKMGVQYIEVWDSDIVSELNLPTQFHRVSDVGNYKVDGLARTIREFAGDIEIPVMRAKITSEHVLLSTLVVSAVDSITARQEIWRALRNQRSGWRFYIDSRMAAEEYQHFLIDADDAGAVSAYEEKLLSMDESSAPELPCTMKATFFTSLVAAGHVGTQVRNIVRGEARSHRLVHVIPANWLQTFPV